jgi:hypothetical protein
MARERRELYSSPNGDRWFLSRDPGTGSIFIRHEANVSSRGYLTEIVIGAFLSGGRNPEHQALLRLIGSLAEAIPRPSSTSEVLFAAKRKVETPVFSRAPASLTPPQPRSLPITLATAAQSR